MGSFIICMFPCWHWLTCGPGWALLQLRKRHNIILLNIMALRGLSFLELRFHRIIKSNQQLEMSILTSLKKGLKGLFLCPKKGKRQVSTLNLAHERASR